MNFFVKVQSCLVNVAKTVMDLKLPLIWIRFGQIFYKELKKSTTNKPCLRNSIWTFTRKLFFNLPVDVSSVVCCFCRHVYDYCTNVNNQGGRGNSVSIQSAPATKAKKSQTGGGAQFVGHELYKRLKDYLKSHLINVLKVCGNMVVMIISFSC